MPQIPKFKLSGTSFETVLLADTPNAQAAPVIKWTD